MGEKYRSRQFYRDATYLAARACEVMTADRVRQPLGGLGIKSSFNICFDSVPLGGVGAGFRHESPEIIVLGGVDPVSGALKSWFLSWTISTRGETGDAVAAAVLNSMFNSPWSLGLSALKTFLS